MTVKILRDGLSVTFTSGSAISDPNSKGNAQIPYIDGGTATLPSVGDALDLCGVEYGYIKVTDIRQEPYGFNHSAVEEEFKYTVSYESEEEANNQFSNFDAKLSVISMESPSEWRYAEALGGTSTVPTIEGDLQGTVTQRLSKVITTGTFRLTKEVYPTQIEAFFDEYIEIAGKLNDLPFAILGTTAETSITFLSGQVLCGALDDGVINKYGNYTFNITFQYKIINELNGTGTEFVSEHDWQYVLAPQVDGAGWMVPVKTTGEPGDEGQVATTSPFIYAYPIAGLFSAFINKDYSQPAIP